MNLILYIRILEGASSRFEEAVELTWDPQPHRARRLLQRFSILIQEQQTKACNALRSRFG
jgi:hypothetical protein